MARRNQASRREVQTDPKYKSALVAQFVSVILRSGKKSIAQRIFYNAIGILEEKTQQDGMNVFKKGLNNVKPALEVKSRRIGGATYQVPMEVKPEKKVSLAFRWILGAARSQKGKPMKEKLAAELLAAYKNEGAAVRKKEDTHRMAEANRAFAHFAR